MTAPPPFPLSEGLYSSFSIKTKSDFQKTNFDFNWNKLRLTSMSLKGFRRKALDLCSYRATSSGFRRCDFQLPPPQNDRFRTFLGVFFISVVSAFIILSIAWSVFRGSFSEDSTSTHCSNSRFSRLFIPSLSPFLLDLFLSTTTFPAEALETGRLCGGIHNCIEKGLCHEDIVCFGQFYAEVIFYRLYPHTKCSVGDTKKISNKFYQGHLP